MNKDDLPLPIMDAYRRCKRFISQVRGRDPWHRPQVKAPKLMLGSIYGRHWVCPRDLGSQTVCYSVGIGEDASFDFDLIKRFGCQVYAFDPTPISVRWVKSQTLPRQFHFYEYGMADHDGTMSFTPPSMEGGDSFSAVRAESFEGSRVAPVQCQVRRMATLMQMLGHDRVDILKMDIEGSEYSVIDDILSSGIRVRQFLVEFHHFFDDVTVKQTQEAVDKLNRAGYRIFSISPMGREYSLILAD